MAGIPVADSALTAMAASILASVKAIQIAVATPTNTTSIVQALDVINTSLRAQSTLLQKIVDAVTERFPSVGKFNPPADLVTVKLIGVSMSVMQLEVGQTAVGKLTFDEISPPADGAVVSDAPGVCPISLAADGETWTCGPALAVGVANVSYSGTSAPPDAGPAVVPNMVVTVVAVPVAEHGDFDPTHAVITGP